MSSHNQSQFRSSRLFFLLALLWTSGTGWSASAQAQSLPAANPISALIPKTTFSLQLEKVIRLPDSSSGNTRFARIEQTTPAIDGSGKIFSADSRGKMYWFTPGDAQPTFYFDFAANVSNFRETRTSGLRSFAFHPNAFTPDTPGYRKLYTAYDADTSNPNESHQSIVSEWTLDAAGNVIATSERQLIVQSQPVNGHNVGKLGFIPNLSPTDPDYGNLYISFGDGGNHVSAQARPGGTDTTLNPRGQDTTNFLGSILRINPLESGSDAYTVPIDNPFVGQTGFLPEIWAYGLRNPHHIGWDLAGNRDMLIADIGQSNIEEINIGVSGANYGWFFREGTFDVTGKAPDNPIAADVLPANHVTDPYTYPVAQIDHDLDNTGQISMAIAGGYVYRGTQVPELRGKYLFGNFANDNAGAIYVVDVDQLQLRDDFTDLTSLDEGFLAPIQELQLTDEAGQPIQFIDLVREDSGVSGLSRTDMRFGFDQQGEIYVTSKRDGWIRRFTSTLSPGDFDTDGDVDGNDLLTWQRNPSVGALSDWQENYGHGAEPVAASQQIPEPTTLLMATLAFLGSCLFIRLRHSATLPA